jgi:hypothetical protein
MTQAKPVYTRGELLDALNDIERDIGAISMYLPWMEDSLADMGGFPGELGQELVSTVDELQGTVDCIREELTVHP